MRTLMPLVFCPVSFPEENGIVLTFLDLQLIDLSTLTIKTLIDHVKKKKETLLSYVDDIIIDTKAVSIALSAPFEDFGDLGCL